jgi:Flp pilus assembly protein TadD
VDKYYADLKRVAELAPDDFHAYGSLGWSQTDRRDFTGAEATLKGALELKPSASCVHGWLTWIYTQLHRYDDALASAKRYAEGAPNEAGAHQALAGAPLNLNQPKDADAELTKAVSLGPKSRSAYYDQAIVKAITGDFAGARDLLERSKATEVQSTDALERTTNAAWVLLAEGKQAEAFALLDATEKDADEHRAPWPAMRALARAWTLWTLGKTAESIKAADAALGRCDSRPESSEL